MSVLKRLPIYMVLLAAAAITIGMMFPTRVVPASAPGAEFSAERAILHLPQIAGMPHPQRSDAQVAVRAYLVSELTAMGLEVEVQQSLGLENVIARLPGTDSQGAVLVLAHYDSVHGSAGAGDNGSGVSVLLEIMRALSSSNPPKNDVIALFDDGEELPDPYSGGKVFVKENALMKDVRIAISLDTAVNGPISTNEVGPDNGVLVGALARAYTNGAWTSFSGGGGYDSTPFREAGIQVYALESNYPFWQQHTAYDTIDLVKPATVQQMGEQTLALVKELDTRDLADTRSADQTFFPVLQLWLVHYPESLSLPLAVAAACLLIAAIWLLLWRKMISWRGIGIGFAMIVVLVVIAVLIVSAIVPQFPKMFGWNTAGWPEWPEVIPPNAVLICGVLALLLFVLTLGGYLLVRRWIGRADLSVIGLVPFSIPAVAVSLLMPRGAYLFIWPVLIGAAGWVAVGILGKKHAGWSLDMAAGLAALPWMVLVMPFFPGIVMSDGLKSLAILAAIEVLLLAVALPAFDLLLVKRKANKP